MNLRKMNFGTDLSYNGRALETYLKSLIMIPTLFYKLNVLHAFLQISGLNNCMPDQFFFQAEMKKKVGGQYTTNACMKCLRNIFSGWRTRWFAVTSEGICYSKKFQETPKGVIDMLFFDRTVKILAGKRHTGLQYGISIYTASRKLTIQADHCLTYFSMLSHLRTSLLNSPYVKLNRFNSFSPVRVKNYARCFVNGEKYFEALFMDLREAKFEVFIRGWWVAPELYLLRPVEQFPESRLDRVLGAAAKR